MTSSVNINACSKKRAQAFKKYCQNKKREAALLRKYHFWMNQTFEHFCVNYCYNISVLKIGGGKRSSEALGVPII